MKWMVYNGTWAPSLAERLLLPFLVVMTLIIECLLIIDYVMPKWGNWTKKEKIGLVLRIVIGNTITAVIGIFWLWIWTWILTWIW